MQAKVADACRQGMRIGPAHRDSQVDNVHSVRVGHLRRSYDIAIRTAPSAGKDPARYDPLA